MPCLWRSVVVRVVRFAVLVAAGILLAYASGRIALAHWQMVGSVFRSGTATRAWRPAHAHPPALTPRPR